MSDNEYYSNSDSENSDKEDSDNEETVISSSKKPLFKPSINIKKITDEKDTDVDDSETDDAESEEDDEDEVQVGGVEDFLDEDEYVKNDDDEEDSDIELNEDGEPIEKVAVNASKNKAKKPQMIVDEDEDDDDEYDENYLQKFDNEIIKNYVNEFHPECLNHNYDEITKLSVIVRNPDGIIIDPLHRTIPYLTKYEKARVLGQRAKQIETGAKPLVKVPENIVDSYIIAELELREKKIPFIIRRPIPGGGCEYWNLKDLEQIAF
jgi:DNA-directed RNA polymerase I, II, and III subunit RPABC2